MPEGYLIRGRPRRRAGLAPPGCQAWHRWLTMWANTIRSTRKGAMATARIMIAACAALAFAIWIAPSAMAQSMAPASKSPAEALAAYNAALGRFKAILVERRSQVEAKRLPNLPGQAVYLARNDLIGAYKDLTDAVPSRIGRPNK